MKYLLFVEEVTKSYEGVVALKGLTLGVQQGSIKGLIGPNGAGKTTLFHLISGVEHPTSGRIYFQGRELTGLRPHQVARLGIGRTFQTMQVMGNMTVVENVLVGMHTRLRGGFLSCGFWLPSVHRSERIALQEAKEILDLLGLLGRWKWNASQLSFAQQRLLELGRALATKPKLLLLDEPAAGLSPKETHELAQKLRQLRRMGMTILIVEHHMEMLMEIADEVAVLCNGELVAEGVPKAVREDRRVIEAYLRGKGDA